MRFRPTAQTEAERYHGDIVSTSGRPCSAACGVHHVDELLVDRRTMEVKMHRIIPLATQALPQAVHRVTLA